MNRTMLFVGAVVATMALAHGAMAASVSELLEKGIYTEETVGNLDQAITIYEKVVAEAKANQSLAAQAQFRLGQCLLKQGKKAEATAAFQKLISGFPGEKELVAKARQFVPGGLPLGDVPWEDGEAMQLNMRMLGGMNIGTIVYVAQSAEHDGQKIWRVGSRTAVIVNNAIGESHVDADWNTFRPISSVYKLSLMGTFTAEFTPTQATVTIEALDGGKSTKKHDLTEVVYDNEQTMDAIRRLPLAVGYKTTLPVFAAMGAGNINIPMEVQGKETVKVPAGEFECFKIHLGLVNQDFWFSADAHRYLVKFEANAVAAELTSISQIKAGVPRVYQDEKQGFSIAAPSDWFFYAPAADGKDATRVLILDPEAAAVSTLNVVKLANLKEEEQKSLRAWAEAGIAEAAKTYKDFAVRADSWQDRTISGRPALSAIADFTDGKKKMATYYTFYRGEAVGLKLATTVRQDALDAFRKQFDPIIDSMKAK